MTLYQISKTVEFVSSFYKLKLNFDLPTAVQNNQQNILEGHYEEFLSY